MDDAGRLPAGPHFLPPASAPASRDPGPDVESGRRRQWPIYAALGTAVAVIAALAIVSIPSTVRGLTPIRHPVPEASHSIYGPLKELSYGSTDVPGVEWRGRVKERKLLAACMRKVGYRFEGLTLNRALVRREIISDVYQTLIADRAFRTRYGYGETSFIAQLPTFGVDVGDPSAALRGRERLAFIRCQRNADRETWPRAAWVELWQAADRAGVARAIREDGALGQAWHVWSQCVAREGFDFYSAAQPQAMIGEKVADFSHRGGVPGSAVAMRLYRDELALAALDWNCRTKSVNPAMGAARNRIEAAFLTAHPELVAKVKRAVADTLGR